MSFCSYICPCLQAQLGVPEVPYPGALPRSGHSLKCTWAPIHPQQRDFHMLDLFCCALLQVTEIPLQADALGPNPGSGCHAYDSVNDLSASICRDLQRLGQAAVTHQFPMGQSGCWLTWKCPEPLGVLGWASDGRLSTPFDLCLITSVTAGTQKRTSLTTSRGP